jgi:thiol:disulfide interchange protein DsbD
MQETTDGVSGGKQVFSLNIRTCLVSTYFLCAVGSAQAPLQPVSWAASIAKNDLKQGTRTTLDVKADIQDGWHVYGLNQAADGPTPLYIAIDENDIAQSAGAVSATKPMKQRDASFGIETETYTHSLVLHLPVQVKQHAPSGDQSVSVSVRFQSCNDRICLPPKTVRLAAPIVVLP